MASKQRAQERTTDLFGEPTATSMILAAAGQVPAADAQRAWVRLIERYREPVRRCLQAKLRTRPDVEADPEAFFTYLFELRVLPKYDRQKGSFRQYVQGVIARYVKSLKRSPRARAEEEVGEIVPAPRVTAALELEEESVWAEAILARALESLGKSRSRDAKILLMSFGIGPHEETTREAIAAELGMKVNAVNVALHRAKARLRELILEDVRELCPDQGVFEREQERMLARLLEGHAGMIESAG